MFDTLLQWFSHILLYGWIVLAVRSKGALKGTWTLLWVFVLTILLSWSDGIRMGKSVYEKERQGVVFFEEVQQEAVDRGFAHFVQNENGDPVFMWYKVPHVQATVQHGE